MGPIVFAAILLVLWFGNFEPLRPVPLLWWVGGGGGGGGGGLKPIIVFCFGPNLQFG